MGESNRNDGDRLPFDVEHVEHADHVCSRKSREACGAVIMDFDVVARKRRNFVFPQQRAFVKTRYLSVNVGTAPPQKE